MCEPPFLTLNALEDRERSHCRSGQGRGCRGRLRTRTIWERRFVQRYDSCCRTGRSSLV